MVICIAEDRQSEEIAVKLLLLSLAKHCPSLPVELFFPPATDRFKQWLTRLPLVKLRIEPIAGGSGWNVKPYALLKLLEEGYEEVWWIDADIILSRDFRSSAGELSPETLVITEEALYGQYRDESYRAQAWGFEVGRILPFNLNTGVLRVTPCHLALLRQWRDLLQTEQYQNAQRLPLSKKPFHLFSDQDVLTALLASQTFANVPIKVLERGKDIIQYFGPAGFTLQERWNTFRHGLPPFIHSQREKPWRRQSQPPHWKNVRKYLDYAWLELSPYAYVAAQYTQNVDQTLEWLHCDSKLGQLLTILGLKNPALTGLPIALLYSSIRAGKRIVSIDDQFNPQQAFLQLNPRPN